MMPVPKKKGSPGGGGVIVSARGHHNGDRSSGSPQINMRGSMRSYDNLPSAGSHRSWERIPLSQQSFQRSSTQLQLPRESSMDNVSVVSDATEWRMIGGRKFQQATPRKQTEELLEQLSKRAPDLADYLRERQEVNDGDFHEPRKSLSRQSLVGTSRGSTPRSSAKTQRAQSQNFPSMESQRISHSESLNQEIWMQHHHFHPEGPVVALQLPRIDPLPGSVRGQQMIVTSPSGGRSLWMETELEHHMVQVDRITDASKKRDHSYALLPHLRAWDGKASPDSRHSPKNKQQRYKQREIERLAGSKGDIYKTLTGYSGPNNTYKKIHAQQARIHAMSDSTRRMLKQMERK